jgi:hypothetical protein
VPLPDSISNYLRTHSKELADRILQSYPPLHSIDDPSSPMIGKLLRKPYPAQSVAIMGLVRRWQQARAGAVIAECGACKTLISLGAVHTHSGEQPFTAVVMVPPQLVEKWCRETILTLPHVRVFIIDGLRTPTNSNSNYGVNEVKLRNKRIVRGGLRTSLSELRLRKTSPSARKRWDSVCSSPAVFVVGRDRAKLGYFWRHAYQVARCGGFQGSVVNPDSGAPVYLGSEGERLLAMDFKKVKLSEMLGQGDGTNHGRRPVYSALWQADGKKIRRFAPIDFIGRYMSDGFFDYAIADEVHELKGGATAQGNALGTLASCARHIAVLTGTLLGGYADELFNILFRLGPSRMLEEGFEYGDVGVRGFTEIYGLLEKITVIEPADNACSEARVTTRVRHRPGASPALFGRFLMSLGAFLSLEDISDALPPYQEEVVSVEMDEPLQKAYEDMEQDIKKALREHRGNSSVISVALNALLAYPDRPFGFGDLIGRELNPETQRREPFLIAATRDLDENLVYAKERRLLAEVKTSLERGRNVQVFAVYTQKRDVTRRLESILAKEGIRVAVLTTQVTPEEREAWYERQLRAGVQVVICHPRLVQTGLDYVEYEEGRFSSFLEAVDALNLESGGVCWLLGSELWYLAYRGYTIWNLSRSGYGNSGRTLQATSNQAHPWRSPDTARLSASTFPRRNAAARPNSKPCGPPRGIWTK